MMALTLARRLGLLAVVMLLLVWLGVLLAGYSPSDSRILTFRPLPAQVAGIVDTVTRTPPAGRAALLAALNGPNQQVRIDPPGAAPTPQARRLDERLMQAYRAALPDRDFQALRFMADYPATTVPRVGWGRREVIELRIPLPKHETLVIRRMADLVTTPFGAPLGLVAGLIGTAIALIALIAMYLELRPLAGLSRAVDRVDLTGAPAVLPDPRRKSPELARLIRAFDRLQTRLSRLLRARFVLVAGISHDVRTYATRLRLRVEAIPDPDQRARAVRDIEDMIQLLNDALLASRVGAGDLVEELLDLSDIARREVEDRAGMPVTLHGSPPAMPVLGDLLALRRMIGNLIENAVKYGHAARVTPLIADGMACVDVEDDGPGLPPDVTETFGEPFVRGETSRSRDTGGAGLGLSIVRNLAEAHGGSLTIIRNGPAGLRLRVAVPLY
ncbi:sensor histidine kinase [Paracoccus laeviglucosivorans]|uniref:histidine kinase n=1 Tax=Paracoccus laeviglucosivorans TaxID=1197861 RepID=A0A521FE51_9RHOB|nr:HAMP domain-containing sensor histidine kinase [Paracoccus laeviglucosivorans]SMO93951.1 Signal transduction histidine kinase [Paracoccus laeviglucosivorans]